MRLIADGVIERDGVGGLAGALGYSIRQIERLVQAELGVTPLAIARAQRAQAARLLIEATSLPMADTALAAGFASVRSFNATVREVFATSPTELRDRAVLGGRPAMPGALRLRLAFRRPLCPDNLFGHLAATAVPGVEEWRDGWYRRTVRLPHGAGIVALAPRPDHIDCRLTLGDLRDLAAAISRCRWLLDLGADPVAVDEQLGADPHLSALVAKAPGRRVPRTVDRAEFAVRAVLGQQVSTAAARTQAGRLVTAHGEAIDDPHGGLTHLFPDPTTLAGLDPATLALPRSRRTTLTTLVTALASGEIDLGPATTWGDARHRLMTVPGVGPWTVETIAMRALGDPDAFLTGDLGVVRAARELGLPSTPAALSALSDSWRPWRAYAVQHLWATSDHAINRLPT